MAKGGQLKGKNQPVPWRIERSLRRVRDGIALLPVSVGPERCERATTCPCIPEQNMKAQSDITMR